MKGKGLCYCECCFGGWCPQSNILCAKEFTVTTKILSKTWICELKSCYWLHSLQNCGINCFSHRAYAKTVKSHVLGKPHFLLLCPHCVGHTVCKPSKVYTQPLIFPALYFTLCAWSVRKSTGKNYHQMTPSFRETILQTDRTTSIKDIG